MYSSRPSQQAQAALGNGAANTAPAPHSAITALLALLLPSLAPRQVGRVGRADTLGLAISLVAAVPEKVWFCSVKGLKPWLNPDSSNTRTNDKGGHTIWWVARERVRGGGSCWAWGAWGAGAQVSGGCGSQREDG